MFSTARIAAGPEIQVSGEGALRRGYAPGLPRFRAFGSELNQVWTNLLDNAADAVDGPGTIVIRTRRNGGGT